jgi:hypothetical protein
MTRILLPCAVALCLAGSAACGPDVDLSKGLAVTGVVTGYYDAGLKDGWNYLKPSITFRLQNVTEEEIGPVQVTASFWRDGDDGEWDSIVLQGIRAEGLAPGASTEPLTVRANIGYRLEGARADFFQHGLFQAVTAKLFGSRGGTIYRLGEYSLDKVIIPYVE